MGALNYFSRKKADKIIDADKGKLQNFFSFQSLKAPGWTSSQLDPLIQEGFQNNVVAYRCCSLISRSLGGLKLKVKVQGDVLEDHPALSLLEGSFARESGQSLLENVSAYLMMAGKSFLGLGSPQHQKSQQILSIRPDSVTTQYDEDGFPNAYVYQVDGYRQESPIDPESGWSRILKIGLFDPAEEDQGCAHSPLGAARRHIDLYNSILSHNVSLLQNGGCPSGAFLVDSPLTDDRRSALRDSIKQNCEGGKNSGRILLLEGGIRWQEMGLSPNHMNFKDGLDSSARAIAQAFGVPPIVIGILGDATFSNYKEARQHLWEDTLLPLADRILRQISLWLSPIYGQALEITYDMDNITALSPKRDDLWKRLEEVSYLTINEKRSILGFAPLSSPQAEEVKSPL